MVIIMVNSDKFKSNNLTWIKNNMISTWSGYASEELCTSLETAISEIEQIKTQINTFDNALSILEKYKKNKVAIANYERLILFEEQNPSLATTETYLENGVNKTRTIYVVDNEKIKGLQTERDILFDDNKLLKTEIEGLLASIIGINSNDVSEISIPKGELSYEDALDLAAKLDVPVEYIIGLHLHEGYEIGDRLIPEGINPDVIHYAGPNGYPVINDMVKDLGDSYEANAPERDTYFIKSAQNFSAIGAGREYNIAGWPITFGEMEGRNVYWTWYGPIAQGFGGNPTPIQCTATELFPCDDGLYRDKDGYIVIAGSPYINQYYDGVHVNYDANGGMEYEDMFVYTPFGLARFYDNGEIKVPNGIECDFYRNDGYESNDIAKTEYGKRLRESAVKDYESLDLYWKDMIH